MRSSVARLGIRQEIQGAAKQKSGDLVIKMPAEGSGWNIKGLEEKT